MTALLIFLIVIVAIAFGPLILLWSLNTLLGMGLAYSFTNWLAGLFLIGLFGKNNVTVNK